MWRNPLQYPPIHPKVQRFLPKAIPKGLAWQHPQPTALATGQHICPARFTCYRLSNFTAGDISYNESHEPNGNLPEENTDRHSGWIFADNLTFF
jgi:hypothetical protein